MARLYFFLNFDFFTFPIPSTRTMPSQSAQNLRKSHALGKEKKEARINGNSQKALSNGSAKKLPKREQIPSDESEYDSAEDTKLLAQLDTSVGFGSDEVSGDDDQMTLNEEQLNGLVQSDESDESELNNGQEVDDQEDGAQENGNDVSGASDEDDADEVPQATTGDYPSLIRGMRRKRTSSVRLYPRHAICAFWMRLHRGRREVEEAKVFCLEPCNAR